MTKTLTNEMKIRATSWIEQTFKALGCSELTSETRIHWRYMHRELGATSWSVKIGNKGNKFGTDFEIILSVRLWPYLPESERYETIVHECCHVVDIFLGNATGNPHGQSWQRLMRNMRCRPKERYPTMHLTPEEYYDIVPKCGICREPGHNRRFCKATDSSAQS